MMTSISFHFLCTDQVKVVLPKKMVWGKLYGKESHSSLQKLLQEIAPIRKIKLITERPQENKWELVYK